MHYTIPQEILTDNGIEFCIALMDIFAIHMRVKHSLNYHVHCIICNAMA